MVFRFNSDVYSEEVSPLLYPDEVKYTVMIPTYRRLDVLREAVQSLLDQGLKRSLAVIIVDNNDNGDQNLNDYAYSLRDSNVALYRNQSNLGMVGNWNRCIELSLTDRLIILHDDDVMTPGSVKLLYSLGYGSQALIGGRWACFGTKAPRFKQLLTRWSNTWYHFFSNDYGYSTEWSYYKILSSHPLSASGMSLCKSSALSLGGYSEDDWPVTDWSFFLNYLVKYGGKKSHKQTLRYRVEINSTANPDLLMTIPKAEMKMKVMFLEKNLESKVRRFIAQFGLMILKKSELITVLQIINESRQFEKIILTEKLYGRVKKTGLKCVAHSIIYIGLCFKKVTLQLRQ
jgi:glycosyltransferase involved in cell wall biosynthesis